MKLTRKSYKRKIIALGVTVFISFSLIATGFAAWVLSATAAKESQGNISVGTTKESAIEISDIAFKDNISDFAFEPDKDDTSGRVQNDGEKFENLSVTLYCTISNVSNVELITVNFELPAGVQKAVDEKYIVAPEIVTTPIEITTTDADTSAPDNSWSYKRQEGNAALLTVTLEFGWGEKFGNMNPSLYYDDEESGGKAIAYDDVKVALDTFKATIYGMTYDDYKELDEEAKEALEAPKYKVTISASA